MEERCRPMLLCSVLALVCALVASAVDRQYLNEWAVEIPGGVQNARSIADEFGYQLVRQVLFFLFHCFPHLALLCISVACICKLVWLCYVFTHNNSVAFLIILDMNVRWKRSEFAWAFVWPLDTQTSGGRWMNVFSDKIRVVWSEYILVFFNNT